MNNVKYFKENKDQSMSIQTFYINYAKFRRIYTILNEKPDF